MPKKQARRGLVINDNAGLIGILLKIEKELHRRLENDGCGIY